MYKRQVVVAAEIALHACLPGLLTGTAPMHEQDQSQASYFGGRGPEDGRIDWSHSAVQIHNLVRAVAPPYPGAFCEHSGHRLRLLRTLLVAPLDPIDVPDGLERGLFSAQGTLFARAGDTALLRVLSADLDGQPLDVNLFNERFGAHLSFDSRKTAP